MVFVSRVYVDGSGGIANCRYPRALHNLLSGLFVTFMVKILFRRAIRDYLNHEKDEVTRRLNKPTQHIPFRSRVFKNHYNARTSGAFAVDTATDIDILYHLFLR